MMNLRRLMPALALALAAGMAGATAPAATGRTQYGIVHEVPLPGDEGWDYLALEPGGHRLFIAHGSRVVVVDTDTLAVTGEIANTPGVHGIAFAPELNRGYVSAGGAAVIVVFDLKTLARVKEIGATGGNPDAILYDPATRRVFSFNGRGHNATAIDASTNTVIGTIPLDAKPEFAVSDAHGHLYVNLEDKSSLARIDPRTLAVTAVWPVAGCEEPSGLALDAVAQRLFPVCDNKVLAVLDAVTGRVLGTAPIGGGVDAAAFDAESHLAFASCGEGVLSVVAVSSSGVPEPVQSLPTRRGARTMALDPRNHRVYLVTADFGATPAATPEHPHPRPPLVPGTFRLLVAEPLPAAAANSAHGGS
jgi:DNA-binding beta-propeller fold protein YncE